MKRVPGHRLPYDQDALFSGQLIERGKQVHFHLDGRKFTGFKGDTVLSAILGAGVDTMGEVFDEAIALNPTMCPVIALKSTPNTSLPMNRTLVQNGQEYISYNRGIVEFERRKTHLKNFTRSIFKKFNRSLEYDFAQGTDLTGAWHEDVTSSIINVDLVIVGGGITGLSAAQHAIKKGWRVALIEQRPVLGGDARFFGAVEDEERPDVFLQKLIAPLHRASLLNMHTNTQVVSVTSTNVRAHKLYYENNSVTSSVVEFETKHIILATGMLERLPVFPGNRLPGVVGSRTAFNLAMNYGIWKGNSAALCTASSAATQVALLAADMGIEISRLADSRISPKSRFFEFSKAYGISLATGSQVVSASPHKLGALKVQLGLADNPSQLSGDPLVVDQLVVCGGWQPDLYLWHLAGGQTKWNEKKQQLQAHGELENIMLAGSCFISGDLDPMSMSECTTQGYLAVQGLSENRFTLTPLSTQTIAHESLDGPLPISEQKYGESICYLDAGVSLARPQNLSVKNNWRKFLPTILKGLTATQEDTVTGYSLNDIVARVILNEIPKDYAGIFAKERCGVSGELLPGPKMDSDIITEATKPVEDAPNNISAPPNFLVGRFGAGAVMAQLELPSGEVLDIGCLIYLDHEELMPHHAIGTVTAIQNSPQDRILAYINISELDPKHPVVVYNGTHGINAQVLLMQK